MPQADDQQSVEFLLGRLDGKVDSILHSIHLHGEQIVAIERRVRTLETSMAKIVGASGVVSSLVAFVIHYFNK